MGFSILVFPSIAQESPWFKMDSLFKAVQPTVGIQFWTNYSVDEKDQVVANGPMETIDNRATAMLRRARFGFKGKPYKRFSFNLNIQYDNLGKDKYSAVRGGTNTGTLGILDAFFTYQITKSEWLYLTAGYLQPQFSRECITGDMVVNSLDKSPSQTYIRQHITGKGYGRATGLNLGGNKAMGVLSFGYNVGVFGNNSTSTTAETTGRYWSPLLVERATLSIGDPEKKTYSINYEANNHFNERKGVTLGVYSSQQEKTDIYSSNYSYGVDLLLNYKGLNLDGEWNLLERKVVAGNFKSRVGHARIGYNLIIAHKYFIEPCFMVMAFDGDAGNYVNGKDHLYDVGINWYLNKKYCKISANYVWQGGHGNNGFTDSKTFRKGNFAALAFVASF